MMKYRTTKQVDYDDNGAVETVKDSHVVSCQRGELSVAFAVKAPEGLNVDKILQACKTLGRTVEDGNQITMFDPKPAAGTDG